MANKRCPYCGSRNTEISISNYAVRGVVNTGRGALVIGASILGGIFGHAAGHVAAHNVIHKTDPGDLKGHHCNNCGKDFSADLF